MALAKVPSIIRIERDLKIISDHYKICHSAMSPIHIIDLGLGTGADRNMDIPPPGTQDGKTEEGAP